MRRNQRDLLSIDAEDVRPDGTAEHRQRPAEGAPRRGIVRVRPQERRKLLPAVGPSIRGEDGQDRNRLAGVDLERVATDGHLGGAEEPDLDSWRERAGCHRAQRYRTRCPSRNVVGTISCHSCEAMDPTSPPRPLTNGARRWPWLVAAVALIALFGLANVLYPAAEANRLFTAMFGAIIFAFVLVGALLSVRVPSNVIGPMLLGSGAMLAVTVAVGTLAIVAAQPAKTSPPPSSRPPLLVNDIGFVVPIIVVLIGVPLSSRTDACCRRAGAGSSC